ncbi:MAG TPA: dTMP kinase [Patescibacteria group bacterium]|jgi:dTMP kinase
MKQTKGMLIALEGGEGAGKTTQLARLTKRLDEAGQKVVAMREPGGTAISEQIREIVLSNKNTGMQETTEVLLFQAARAQIYAEVVIPALKEGKIVLMDRTRDSSVVYQGIVRGFGRKLIEQLNDISTQKTTPNLTILLDVDVEIGLGRRNGTGTMNRLDLENGGFHQKVRTAYLQLAKENQGKRWLVVDANRQKDEVEEMLWQILAKRLKR